MAYDLTIELKADDGRHLYEQIYEYIKREIREGKLPAGGRLPSARSLAEYLQVSRSTVDMAYSQLQSEGYIEAKAYRGYFVCRIEELFRLETGAGAGNERTRGASLQEEQAKGQGQAKAWAEAQMPVRYDFSPNGIDIGAFPFSVWSRITKGVLGGGNGLYLLGEPQGDYELRLTISQYLHSSRGVNCSPDQIVVGAGNDYLLLLLEKILGRDRKIAMENPTYIRAYRIFRSCGYRIIATQMDESGIRMRPLEEGDASIVYVMPSHQYPTGAVMPIGRRAELLGWAEKKEERYVIEDDYDSEFRYRGKPIPSLQSSDKSGKVIYIGTFSKAIAPAIRVSYMVLPRTLLDRYRRDCSFYACTVSRIDQRILNEFIRDGYFERHLNRMRKLYRARHEQMLRCLGAFEGNFRISGENAGLHLLLTSLKGVEEERLIARAREKEVRVYGLSDCLIGERDRRRETEGGTVLLGFGGLSEEEIAGGMERLQEAWLRQ